MQKNFTIKNLKKRATGDWKMSNNARMVDKFSLSLTPNQMIRYGEKYLYNKFLCECKRVRNRFVWVGWETFASSTEMILVFVLSFSNIQACVCVCSVRLHFVKGDFRFYIFHLLNSLEFYVTQHIVC